MYIHTVAFILLVITVVGFLYILLSENICRTGEYKDGNTCKKCSILPSNSQWTHSNTDVCNFECSEGFRKKGTMCEIETSMDNLSSSNSTSSNITSSNDSNDASSNTHDSSENTQNNSENTNDSSTNTNDSSTNTNDSSTNTHSPSTNVSSNSTYQACDYTKGGPCFKNNSKMRTKCNREAICGGCVDKGLSWTDLNKDC